MFRVLREASGGVWIANILSQDEEIWLFSNFVELMLLLDVLWLAIRNSFVLSGFHFFSRWVNTADNWYWAFNLILFEM